MSYATSLAHLDASTGLFASAIPGIIYALFGTCRQLNVGPEAALSLLIGQTISSLVSLDPHSKQGKIEAEAVSTIVVFQVRMSAQWLGVVDILNRDILPGWVDIARPWAA